MNIIETRNQRLLFAGCIIGLAAFIVPFALNAQENASAEGTADYYVMPAGEEETSWNGNVEAPYPGIPGGIENLNWIKGQLGIGGRSDTEVREEGTMCTMDAMQCPDGSWVGRSGPNCEFVCGGAGTSVDVSGEIQGDWNSGASESSSPGFFGSISNIFDVDSWFSADVEGEVSSDGDETTGFSVVEESDIALNGDWFDSFFSGFWNWFGFGWWGMENDEPGDDEIDATATFSAQPTSGSAPLTVTFSSVLRNPQQYSINFGDGTSGHYERCSSSDPMKCSIEHTYRQSGTYTAQLIYSVCPANADMECLAPVQIAATVIVKVR